MCIGSRNIPEPEDKNQLWSS